MSESDESRSEPRDMVDEMRAARAGVSREAGGLDGLGAYLGRIQEEYRSRTGRFADLPTVRPPEVRQLIDTSETEN